MSYDRLYLSSVNLKSITTIGDNISYGHEGQATPEYAGPTYLIADDLLRSLTEGQRAS
jgi:hypothetical protein